MRQFRSKNDYSCLLGQHVGVMLEKNEEVREKKGLTEKLYVTTCQLEEKVVANTLQQTEENVGEGAPESSSTDDKNMFDDVWKVSEFWRARVKSQLWQRLSNRKNVNKRRKSFNLKKRFY